MIDGTVPKNEGCSDPNGLCKGLASWFSNGLRTKPELRLDPGEEGLAEPWLTCKVVGRSSEWEVITPMGAFPISVAGLDKTETRPDKPTSPNPQFSKLGFSLAGMAKPPASSGPKLNKLVGDSRFSKFSREGYFFLHDLSDFFTAHILCEGGFPGRYFYSTTKSKGSMIGIAERKIWGLTRPTSTMPKKVEI